MPQTQDIVSKTINEIIVKDLATGAIKKTIKNLNVLVGAQKKQLQVTQISTKGARNFSRTLTEVRSKLTSVERVAQKFNISASALDRSLMANNERLQGMNIVSRETGRVVGTLDKRIRTLRANMRPFNFSMLSIMFAGMALQRTFGGMVRQVLDLTGIFEVWRAVLIQILLPILFPFTQKLMELMFWMTKHPVVAKMVGVFIIFMAVLGAAMAFAGQLSLALMGIGTWKAGSGLIAWFGKGGIWSKTAGFFKAVTSSAGIMLAVITAAIVGIFIAWKEKFGDIGSWMKAWWEGAKQQWNGFWDILTGFVDLFVSIIKGDFDGLWEAIKKIFLGGIDILVGFFKSALSGIVVFALGILRVVTGIINTIISGLNKIPGFNLPKLLPGEGKLFGEFDTDIEGSRQFGGFISRTGLYQLHAGESVIPPGGASPVGGATININASVQSDMDVKILAEKISRELRFSFERDFGERVTR